MKKKEILKRIKAIKREIELLELNLRTETIDLEDITVPCEPYQQWVPYQPWVPQYPSYPIYCEPSTSTSGYLREEGE